MKGKNSTISEGLKSRKLKVEPVKKRKSFIPLKKKRMILSRANSGKNQKLKVRSGNIKENKLVISGLIIKARRFISVLKKKKTII